MNGRRRRLPPLIISRQRSKVSITNMSSQITMKINKAVRCLHSTSSFVGSRGENESLPTFHVNVEFMTNVSSPLPSIYVLTHRMELFLAFNFFLGGRLEVVVVVDLDLLNGFANSLSSYVAGR